MARPLIRLPVDSLYFFTFYEASPVDKSRPSFYLLFGKRQRELTEQKRKLKKQMKKNSKKIREPDYENNIPVPELMERLKSLEEAIDSSEDLIISLDRNGVLLFLNKAFSKYYSVDRSQVIGSRITEFADEDRFNKNLKPIFDRVLQGNSVREEISYDFPEMGTRYFSALFSPQKGERKDEILITGVMRDITDRALMENKIKESEKQYSDLLNRMNDTVWVTDFEANFIYVNDRAVRTLGYTKEELLSMGPADIDTSMEKEKIIELIRGMKTDQVKVFETSYKTKDGRVISVEINSSLVSYKGKTAILSLARNITRRKKAEEALLEERTKLRSLHRAVDQLQRCETEDELWDKALEVTLHILKLELCIFYVLEKDKLVPRAVSRAALPEGLKTFNLDEGIAGRTFRERKTIQGNDLRRWKEAKPVREDVRSFISIPIGNVGVIQIFSAKKRAFSPEDVSLVKILAGHLREEAARIRLEHKLRAQTVHDPLTGLFNRRYFDQSIKKEVKRAKRYKHPLGILMIDINSFKEINDRFSHMTGDKVLAETARLLKETVRETDMVVRYGGDEFLIVFPETTKEPFGVIIGRIRKNLDEWNKKQDIIDFPLTLAMGGSCLKPGTDETIETVIKKADQKMYEDKKGKKKQRQLPE